MREPHWTEKDEAEFVRAYAPDPSGMTCGFDEPGPQRPSDTKEARHTGDHPLTDPGDGRSECDVCGKWVWLVTHSCKGVPVSDAARARMVERNPQRPSDTKEATE